MVDQVLIEFETVVNGKNVFLHLKRSQGEHDEDGDLGEGMFRYKNPYSAFNGDILIFYASVDNNCDWGWYSQTKNQWYAFEFHFYENGVWVSQTLYWDEIAYIVQQNLPVAL